MTPERGDILHLQFDPASGRGMKGNHFRLVVSPRDFNARFQLAMVCPISGGLAAGARQSGFLISLIGAGLRTNGHVQAHQLMSLDWTIRNARLVGRAPAHIIDEVLDCLTAALERQEPHALR